VQLADGRGGIPPFGCLDRHDERRRHLTPAPLQAATTADAAVAGLEDPVDLGEMTCGSRGA
jgi:hypothetical protein